VRVERVEKVRVSLFLFLSLETSLDLKEILNPNLKGILKNKII